MAKGEQAPKVCPTCGTVLEVLLFMGIQPEGYVCPRCSIHYDDDLRPGATAIGREEGPDDERKGLPERPWRTGTETFTITDTHPYQRDGYSAATGGRGQPPS